MVKNDLKDRAEVEAKEEVEREIDEEDLVDLMRTLDISYFTEVNTPTISQNLRGRNQSSEGESRIYGRDIKSAFNHLRRERMGQILQQYPQLRDWVDAFLQPREFEVVVDGQVIGKATMTHREHRRGHR
ncbi:hypothetical protein EV426DRAFT_717627 [Tirmania nivea]|nr:hypothetical protein EV426DRAFT_717627 [Tirmania nivea]